MSFSLSQPGSISHILTFYWLELFIRGCLMARGRESSFVQGSWKTQIRMSAINIHYSESNCIIFFELHDFFFLIFKMITYFIVKMGSFFAVFPSSFAHTALSLWNTLQDYYYIWNEHILINTKAISNVSNCSLYISILSLHFPCGGLICKPFLSWKMCYSH